jgi:hypothetical protein
LKSHLELSSYPIVAQPVQLLSSFFSSLLCFWVVVPTQQGSLLLVELLLMADLLMVDLLMVDLLMTHLLMVHLPPPAE